jgi:alpha-amylase/alpha-mannosidase (GH57 family)
VPETIRYLIIHGHFYQPPRENPWIEDIEVQDSAAPYHDWNERITAECYGPNTAARIVAGDGGILSIVNNFTSLSFNVGPTLLAWLERGSPSTYRAILDADRASLAERGGHGNAIAQAYNHAILPLCSPRDRLTQVRWGIVDFERRFGRRPEGMWLPECAADLETLRCLEGEGIRFTVLGPGQARRFRAEPAPAWTDGIDPRRAYRVELGGGRAIAAFFYDGAVARDISFGDGLRDRDAFVDRLIAAFGETGPGKWLVNVATDGETFGHHRSFGDMVLAATFERLERERPALLTNYGRFLELCPPQHLAEIHEPSSWSCAHGVSRWTDDCGCSTGAQPGWHQKWRRPLREALDDLRDRLAEIYERRAATLFADPWKARDAYVEVVLDRGDATVDAFLEAQAARRLEASDRILALKLLEMQRHALLMYTSCGWFFAELSGPEPVQVLKYAARAIQLAREVDGATLEPAFQKALARAPTNFPDVADGARVLDRRVRPSIVNLAGVVAHYAISSLFETYAPRGRIFCYRYQQGDSVRRSRGGAHLVVGHVELASEITSEATDATYTVLHFGGHDVRCAIGAYGDLAGYDEMKAELVAAFELRSLSDVVHAMDRRFVGKTYALSELFLDERRKIVAAIVRDLLQRRRQELYQLFEENRALLRFLAEADSPVPPLLRAAADFVLSARLAEHLAEARYGTRRFDDARAGLVHLMSDVKALGADIDLAEARRILETRILEEARSLRVAPRRDTARALLGYLETAQDIELGLTLWEAQNLYWTLMLDGPRGPDADADLLLRIGSSLGFDEGSLMRAWKGQARAAPSSS